ncbi:PREDICTED: uncharacterized protein LOC109233438 [Nicotiana attenuata]|uniref:uncharacterized protein LOC109233438 n=1 Tax=Nicotiana attenuata TaxID=49451 RepID=UPI00090507DA|nr:PREDICTED: uncharacterized protein LOC109233438 [Nicotiana attenuata]
MECVTIVNYTILINGETTKPFDAARGLRQGDPIFPFLFATAMKYLSRNLKTLKQEKGFHYHPMCSRLYLTHLSFADDLLLFVRGDAASVALLHNSFNIFSAATVARISSWTAKKLSYAGRIQLVQHVIFGIQAYWAQIFIIPAKVVKAIDAYFRSYVWSGENIITKKSLVAWDRMCAPRATGGLNLINLALWNKAAITKTCWELANKKDKLWIKWIHS